MALSARYTVIQIVNAPSRSMRCPGRLLLAGLLGVTPVSGTAQSGLSLERAAGLGLKAGPGPVAVGSDLAFGGEAAQLWRSRTLPDYALYGGLRERPRIGLAAAESYGGVVYALPRGWGSSVEAGYSPETALAPQRYTLSGQVHSSSASGGVSIGLKYRVYDPGSRGAEGAPFNGYTLAPSRLAGAYGPSYQVQMSYQYSSAGALGLALGREVETYTPFADPAAFPSGPRQFSITGQHWLTPTWALSYDVMSHDISSPLKLQGLRLGVRYRF